MSRSYLGWVQAGRFVTAPNRNDVGTSVASDLSRRRRKNTGRFAVRITWSLARILTFAILFAALSLAEAGDRFSDNGDGTVTDHELGLMWGATDNNGDINWHEAEKWVKFTFPYTLPKTYDNWRLPSLAELQSILVNDKAYKGYETDCGQWVKTIVQIQLSCGWVWTSETDPVAPTARIFNFDNVYHYTVRKAHRRGYRALAVRNIE